MTADRDESPAAAKLRDKKIVEYDDEEFSSVRLTDCVLARKHFTDCRFVKCTFTGVQFKTGVFGNCSFTDCSFTAGKFPDTIFRDAVFLNCKLMGVDWTEAAWSDRGLPGSVAFRECLLDHSTFYGLKLAGTKFSACVCRDTDFSEADLSRADFSGTDLRDSVFRRCNLRQADFSGARDYTISPVLNDVRKARFNLPEAMSLLYELDIIIG